MRIADRLSARLRAARGFRPRGYVALKLRAEVLGWLRRDRADRVRAWPETFEFSENDICLRPALESELSAALARVAQALARDGAIGGWREETYAIRANDGVAVLFHLERAAMRFFGLRASAAHLNGYTGEAARLRILVARRAATKAIDPGTLDNLVAGGVRSREDARQTLLRECGEEAGIPAALAEGAKRAGSLHVCREVAEGLHRETLLIHDLALPADFTPRNTDGEVSEFLSFDAQQLLERIARGEMTVEAGLVAVDFALRHGLSRDADGSIAGAVARCRRQLPA